MPGARRTRARGGGGRFARTVKWCSYGAMRRRPRSTSTTIASSFMHPLAGCAAPDLPARPPPLPLRVLLAAGSISKTDNHRMVWALRRRRRWLWLVCIAGAALLISGRLSPPRRRAPLPARERHAALPMARVLPPRRVGPAASRGSRRAQVRRTGHGTAAPRWFGPRGVMLANSRRGAREGDSLHTAHASSLQPPQLDTLSALRRASDHCAAELSAVACAVSTGGGVRGSRRADRGRARDREWRAHSTPPHCSRTRL